MGKNGGSKCLNSAPQHLEKLGLRPDFDRDEIAGSAFLRRSGQPLFDAFDVEEESGIWRREAFKSEINGRQISDDDPYPFGRCDFLDRQSEEKERDHTADAVCKVLLVDLDTPLETPNVLDGLFRHVAQQVRVRVVFAAHVL